VRQASSRIHELHTLCERLRADLKRAQTSLTACEAERDTLRTQLQNAEAQTLACHAEKSTLAEQSERIKELEAALYNGQMKQVALAAENDVLRKELELRDRAVSESFVGVSNKLTRAERDMEDVYARLQACMQDKEAACTSLHAARAEAKAHRDRCASLVAKLRVARDALGRAKMTYACVPAWHVRRQQVDTYARRPHADVHVYPQRDFACARSAVVRGAEDHASLRVGFLLWRMVTSRAAPAARAAAHTLRKHTRMRLRRVMHLWFGFASATRQLARIAARCAKMAVHACARRVMHVWGAAAKWLGCVYQAEDRVEEAWLRGLCRSAIALFVCIHL
jgi:hypothetical protein